MKFIPRYTAHNNKKSFAITEIAIYRCEDLINRQFCHFFLSRLPHAKSLTSAVRRSIFNNNFAHMKNIKSKIHEEFSVFTRWAEFTHEWFMSGKFYFWDGRGKEMSLRTLNKSSRRPVNDTQNAFYAYRNSNSISIKLNL